MLPGRVIVPASRPAALTCRPWVTHSPSRGTPSIARDRSPGVKAHFAAPPRSSSQLLRRHDEDHRDTSAFFGLDTHRPQAGALPSPKTGDTGATSPATQQKVTIS